MIIISYALNWVGYHFLQYGQCDHKPLIERSYSLTGQAARKQAVNCGAVFKVFTHQEPDCKVLSEGVKLNTSEASGRQA